MPWVGLAIGNEDGNGAVEVILPNGRSCTHDQHAVPGFGFVDDITGTVVDVPEEAGVAATEDGTIYLCGGLDRGGEKQGDEHK